MIHITIGDGGASLDTIIDVDIVQQTGSFADNTLTDLAGKILASSTVQNMGWAGTPHVSSITRDTVEQLFP